MHIPTINAFDRDSVAVLPKRVPRVVTAENYVVTGGRGGAVADLSVEADLAVRMRKAGIPHCFGERGSIPYLAQRYQLGVPDIATAARELLR